MSATMKAAVLLFVVGLVAQNVHAQWLGWPYYGGWPAYGYLGLYGKRSAGFDANPAVTGSTPTPISAYPSGMKFESTTSSVAPPPQSGPSAPATETTTSPMPSTAAPQAHK